jgi:hypothetical protein
MLTFSLMFFSCQELDLFFFPVQACLVRTTVIFAL